MSIPTMTPRGWYADPRRSHESRYWDGESWTDQVADHGLLSTDRLAPSETRPTGAPIIAPHVAAPRTTAVLTPTAPATAIAPAPASVPSAAPARRRRTWLISVIAVIAVLLVMVGWILWSRWVPGAPTALSVAQPPTATSVQIGWTASTGGPGVDSYLIQRDGDRVGSVAAVTSFTDAGLVPDTTYRYTVVAASGSKQSDPSAELVIHTLPATPADVRVADATATTVSIAWSAPEAGPQPESYVVLRNDVEVATLSGAITSYEDTKLTPFTTYQYRVVAVSGTNRSAVSEQLSAQTLPGTPTGLKVGALTTSSITVQWVAPPGPAPESYLIQRDGKQVASVAGGLTSYLDKGLAPTTAYQYTVVAVSGSSRSEPSVELTARTYAPSVTAARFQGAWDVDGKITKATSGLTLGSAAAQGRTFSATWTVTPKCTTGACDAVVSGYLAGHPFSMTLVRSGGTYAGSTKAHVSHCTGLGTSKDVTNSLTMALRVTQAEVASQQWLATAWTGTLTMTSPYTSAGSSGSIRYYCPTGSLTAAITGSR